MVEKEGTPVEMHVWLGKFWSRLPAQIGRVSEGGVVMVVVVVERSQANRLMTIFPLPSPCASKRS